MSVYYIDIFVYKYICSGHQHEKNAYPLRTCYQIKKVYSQKAPTKFISLFVRWDCMVVLETYVHSFDFIFTLGSYLEYILYLQRFLLSIPIKYLYSYASRIFVEQKRSISLLKGTSISDFVVNHDILSLHLLLGGHRVTHFSKSCFQKFRLSCRALPKHDKAKVK